MKYFYLTLVLLVAYQARSCRINIISSGITYDYVQNSVYTVEPQIRIRRANLCRTLIFEVIPNGESEFVFVGGSHRLPVSMNFDSNDNFNTRGSVISTSVNPIANGTYTYPFYFGLIDSEIPRSRRYNLRLTLRVYEMENPGVYLATRNNRHRLEVPPIFSIDFNSSDNTIDFGALERGKESTLQMEVDGNIGYTVSMRSQEGGVLKNTFNPATIRYLMSWQGNSVSLSNTWTIVGTYGQSNQLGLIRATIDEDTDGKTDGDYRDVIEVLVETQ